MWGRFQGGGIEARRHTGLAFSGARAGIMAAGTVLGFWWRGLLALKTRGQDDRNGSEPDCIRGCHDEVFFNTPNS
jgi:hypothetical protein